MKITFLGTGTSTGVPVIGCECDVCASDNPRNRRTRVSAMLSWEGVHVVLDTGPDFREQMLRHRVRSLNAALFTHSHVDHLYGLDDIRIFCFRAGGRIPVYGEADTLARIRQVFDYAFVQQVQGGGVPQLDLVEIVGPFDLFGKEVVPLRVWHGRTPVLAFRIGNFAYVTDCNVIPPESLEQLEDLDVLVLDALRPKPHSTHFSIPEAVAVAQKLRAAQTYFIHMTHDVDHDATNAELPRNIQLAYDGLEIEV